MRRLLLLLALPALPAPAAAAPVQVADAEMHALTTWRGGALALVDSRDREAPFALVRSTGRGRSHMGTFGTSRSEFPDIAGRGGRAYVTWGVPISGGAAVTVAPVQDPGEPLATLVATGPSWLAVGAARLHVAYPDRDGNAALAAIRADEDPAGEPMTLDAPHRRHLPLGAAAADDGPLVLDLVQERARTELRVIGPGAPARAILSVPSLRHYRARMAVSGPRIAVGYVTRAGARVATARLGGTWSVRRLPRGAGLPSPAFWRGSLRAVYARGGDVYAWSGGAERRLTATAHAERDPLAAGRFVAWTRRDARTGRASTWLTRLG